MQALKHIALFTKNNFKQLQRKWYSLPLLLIFPVIIVIMVAFFIAQMMGLEEAEPVQVGIIDLDQSKETEMIANIMEESPDISQFITIKKMTEQEAKSKIKQNQLAAYITFPDRFTRKLYTGDAVDLQVTGNPQQQTESQLVHTLLKSISRHINGSQSNILAINDYAKKLDISDEERQEIVFDQFKSFLFFTLSKDDHISEETLRNEANTSPIEYYSIASWFIISTIWLFILFHFLHNEDEVNMRKRMQLYGVTEFQQIVAKIIVSFIISCIFMMGSFIALLQVLNLDFGWLDYKQIFEIMGTYSLIFLISLAIIEQLCHSVKFRILLQVIWTGSIILLSGAIIPTIYFPLRYQDLIEYVFTTETFSLLIHILLEDALYIDVQLLYITWIISIALVTIISLLKGRIQR